MLFRSIAVFVALVDVAARSQQQLEALGVAVPGSNVNRRNAVVVALVDVTARSQQQCEAVGVAILGGRENRRTAIFIGHVNADWIDNDVVFYEVNVTVLCSCKNVGLSRNTGGNGGLQQK